MIDTAEEVRRPIDTAPAAPPGEHRLRRDAVSLPGALAQSVSAMAPAMSGAFITYLAAIKAGGATPLAFLLATGSCLLIGGVVSRFALRLPSAGSLYTYTADGLGSFWGFLTGCLFATATVLAAPAALAGFAVFTSLVMGNVGAPAVLGHWWAWFGFGLALYFLLSWFAIEISTRVQLVLTAATVAALLLLAAVIIGKGGAHGNTLAVFSPGATGVSWTLVVAGMAFGILSFAGFESAAVLAEEARNPRRAIPRAVIGSLVLGGLFYLVVTYATAIGYGAHEATVEWPKSAAGLAALADRYAASLVDWVLLAGGVSALMCGLSIHNAATRTFFAMGRDGLLPKRLARTHPRYQTPHVAIATNLGLMVAVAAVVIGVTSPAARDAVGATPGPLSAGFYLFAEGLTIVAPLAMLCYVLLSLAGIRAAGRGRGLATAIGALLASTAALFGSLYYSVTEAAPGAGIPGPYRAVPAVVLAVVGSLGAAALVLRRRRPAAWAAVGTVFE